MHEKKFANVALTRVYNGRSTTIFCVTLYNKKIVEYYNYPPTELQWRSQKYFPGGANGGGLGALAPSGVQGRSPGGGSGGEAFQKLITFF